MISINNIYVCQIRKNLLYEYINEMVNFHTSALAPGDPLRRFFSKSSGRRPSSKSKFLVYGFEANALNKVRQYPTEAEAQP